MKRGDERIIKRRVEKRRGKRERGVEIPDKIWPLLSKFGVWLCPILARFNFAIEVQMAFLVFCFSILEGWVSTPSLLHRRNAHFLFMHVSAATSDFDLDINGIKSSPTPHRIL